MKKCKECGYEMLDKAKFCTKCGASQDENSGGGAAVHPRPEAGGQYAISISAKEQMIYNHKRSMVNFKRVLAIVMIVCTVCAIIIGMANAGMMTASYTEAVGRAENISNISSVGGKTLEETYYRYYGVYLQDSIHIDFVGACILSGLYQTLLWFSLFYWIYLVKKTSFQKKMLDLTGDIE